MTSFGVTCVSKTRRPQCDIDKLIDRNNPALNGLAAVLNTSNTTSSATFPATGGIVVSTGDTITGTTTLTLASTTTAGNVVINSAGTGATSFDLNASGGMTLDAAGAFSIDSLSTTAGSNISTVGAAGVDFTVASSAGSLILNGGEAAADAIQLTTTNAAGGIDVNAGTGGYAMDTTGGFSIDSSSTTVASNVTTVGAAGVDLTLSSTAGSVNLLGGEAAVNAVTITATNAAGGLDLNSGTGGFTLDTTGAFSIDSTSTTVASNITTVGAAGFDLTVASTAGSLILNGGEAAADAIQITATNAAGGIDINAGTGGIDVTSGGGILETYAAGSTKAIDAGGTAILTLGTAAAPDVTVNSGDLVFASALRSISNSASGSVTQTTSNTTAVTSNSTFTRITMFAASAAANTAGFVVNNSTVGVNSSILLTCEARSAVAGIAPSYSVSGIGAGSYTINITNQDGANALAAAAIFHALVINPV